MKSRKLTQKEFYNYKDEYYVIDLSNITEEQKEEILKTIKRHATGWYYVAGSYYAFKKAKDREIVKGVLAWDKIAS